MKKKPIAVAATPTIGNYQLPSDGFSPASGHEREADGIEGGIDGQRAADAKHAGAVRHRSGAGRHHQRPDHHALRIASRARREAGKDRRARTTTSPPRSRPNASISSRPFPAKAPSASKCRTSVKTKVIMRDLLESEEWQQHQGAHSARAGQGCLRPSDHRRPRRKCRTC